MHGIRRMLFVVSFSILLAGCATQQLVPVCSTAQLGIAMAQVALADASLSPERVAYWQRWLKGAQDEAALLCVGVGGAVGTQK